MSLVVLEKALSQHLENDAQLQTLVGHGVWPSVRPEEDFISGQPKTWIVYTVFFGQDRHRWPGRWKDVLVFIQANAHVDEGADQAVIIDNRIGEIVDGWTPDLSPNYTNVWPAVRRYTIEGAVKFKRRVRKYSHGAMYRFRFGDN